MTDRERLLEQVERQEQYAAGIGASAACWIANSSGPWDGESCEVKAVRQAEEAAHHALTAMALREAIYAQDIMAASDYAMIFDVKET